MKKIIALSVLAAAPVFATAELSANLGWASEYVYRGTVLAGDGTISGGLDYSNGGFYMGTWASQYDGTADPKEIEVDIYAGYGFTVGELDLGIGATTYQYENTGDQEYELNLSAAYGPFSLSVNPGKDDDDGAEETDYIYSELAYATSVQGVDLGLALGNFTPDSDSDEDDTQHIQLNLGTTFEGLDLGVSLMEGLNADSDSAGVLSISKSFSL